MNADPLDQPRYTVKLNGRLLCWTFHASIAEDIAYGVSRSEQHRDAPIQVLRTGGAMRYQCLHIINGKAAEERS